MACPRLRTPKPSSSSSPSAAPGSCGLPSCWPVVARTARISCRQRPNGCSGRARGRSRHDRGADRGLGDQPGRARARHRRLRQPGRVHQAGRPRCEALPGEPERQAGQGPRQRHQHLVPRSVAARRRRPARREAVAQQGRRQQRRQERTYHRQLPAAGLVARHVRHPGDQQAQARLHRRPGRQDPGAVGPRGQEAAVLRRRRGRAAAGRRRRHDHAEAEPVPARATAGAAIPCRSAGPAIPAGFKRLPGVSS